MLSPALPNMLHEPFKDGLNIQVQDSEQVQNNSHHECAAGIDLQRDASMKQNYTFM